MAENQFARVSANEIEALWRDEKTLFDAVELHVRTIVGAEAHVDKVGFARSIVSLLADYSQSERPVVSDASVELYSKNFGSLLRVLAAKQRVAERAGAGERISQRVDRAIKNFLRDHSSGCRKEEAELLFEDIETVLDETIEGDQVQLGLQQLRREFALSDDSGSRLGGFDQFADRLRQVRYSPRIVTQNETATNGDFVKAAVDGMSAEVPAETHGASAAVEDAARRGDHGQIEKSTSEAGLLT